MFSSAAGPFSRAGPSNALSAAQTPFQRLKPVCVELLSLTGRTSNPTSTAQTIACLRRLKTTLRSLLATSTTSSAPRERATASTSRLIAHNEEPTLPPSLVSYVFYPLSELISTAPKGITSLTDSIVEGVLEVLSLLCSQWWTAWSQKEGEGKGWQTWCDLVILASSVLGSPTPTTKNGSEAVGEREVVRNDGAKRVAIKVLEELLLPRFRARQTTRVEQISVDEWEWDGVSELPSLDEIAAQTNRTTERFSNGRDSADGEMELIFPIREHLTYATTDRIAKGAISFVLSSCFAIAESSQETTEARTAAIGVARNALLLWIGGTCPFPPTPTLHKDEKSAWLDNSPLHCVDITPPFSGSTEKHKLEGRKAVALRLRPLLPGITSSLTRLATSRLKSKQDGTKQKATPSAVVAESVAMLGDLLRATLADDCLTDVLTTDITLSRADTQANTEVKVANLEDFAYFEARSTVEEEKTSPSEGSNSEPSTAGQADKEVQWTLSTLAQVHLALKNFSPLTTPSLPGTTLPSFTHPAVQSSMLRLSVLLLTECSQSFGWLDTQLKGMARLDANANSNGDGASSIETILTWVIDLASTHNSASTVTNAKLAFEALQKSDSAMSTGLKDGSAMWGILTAALDRLPAVIGAGDDGAVSRLVLRVSTILQLLSEQSTKSSTTTSAADLTKLAQDIHQPSTRLLRPLKVEHLTYTEDPPSESSNPTWRLQPSFPGLESSTSRQLSQMFHDFGRSLALSLLFQLKSSPNPTGKADAGEVFAMIIHLIDQSGQLRTIRVDHNGARRGESVVCLVVASDMLRGVAGVLGNMEIGLLVGGGREVGKQVRKVAHKLGKRVFGLVMDVLDGDGEEAVSSPSPSRSSSGSGETVQNEVLGHSSRELTTSAITAEEENIVERIKGISLAPSDLSSSTPARLGPVLDLSFVRSADLTRSSPSSTQFSIQQRFTQAQLELDLSNSLLFSLLSSASRLLGQSFRPLLLRGAYPLVSAMSISSTSSSTSSDILRQAAQAAVRDIAFHTAYGDIKNCLLDHADYILGSACQRLIGGLDEELRSLAYGGSSGGKGGEGEWGFVVPLVSAQRAPFVLVEMIRVLGSEVVPMVEDAIDEVLDALDRFHAYGGVADGLLGVLGGILECMAAEQSALPPVARKSPVSAKEKDRDEVEDFKTWLTARQQESKVFDEAPQDNETKINKEEGKGKGKEEEDKPTKSQQVTTQILTKATFFLTQPSPSLRIRVLHLLRHGILTLAPQTRTAELLPMINSAWPYIMTRLGLPYSTTTTTSSSSKLSPIIDLNPTTVGERARERDAKWFEKVEKEMVEKDVGVWVAAAKYVEAAVEWVPDFVGKRVVDEAWPRFELLLKLIRWRFDPRHQHSRSSQQRAKLDGSNRTLTSSERNITSTGLFENLSSSARSKPRPAQYHSHTEHPFIHPSITTLPAQLTLCIIATLTSIVRHLGQRMPDDAAWAITIHPSLLEALDSRQPPGLIRAAEKLYTELGRRNGEATKWALQCAFPAVAQAVSGGEGKRQKREATPCFMVHTRAQVHGETMHCVLEEMRD